ncbi:MAG TPA: hypothetical protein VFR03_21230 [Thermoanaerobaculia bacterium]|nr:hypothetical protein [Thermoanaerobaculia bacterium]
MTSFSGSPRLMKGALVGIDVFNPLASITIFQYNPEKMTRRSQVQALGDGECYKAETRQEVEAVCGS